MTLSSKTTALLCRLALLPAIIVYGLMAYNYLSHPIEKLGAVGIVAGSPLALTILRIFFGGFPLGCCLILAGCFLSSRWLLAGVAFSATTTAAILVVRLFGMFADGTVQKNTPAAATEATVLVFTLLCIWMELSRRRQPGA